MVKHHFDNESARPANGGESDPRLPAASVPFSDHILIDGRSRDFHALIASRIQKDPLLIDVARRNIARWRGLANPEKPEPYYLAAWERELDKGLEHTLALMVEDSEYATQLRQSSPFAGVIGQRERVEFFQKWNEHNWNT